MEIIKFSKQKFYDLIGMVGYFPRDNASSVDVMWLDKYNNFLLVGIYGYDELYKVDLVDGAFDLGVEHYHLNDMREVRV